MVAPVPVAADVVMINHLVTVAVAVAVAVAVLVAADDLFVVIMVGNGVDLLVALATPIWYVEWFLWYLYVVLCYCISYC